MGETLTPFIQKKGYSITEILVTLLIMGMVITPVFMSFTSSQRNLAHSRDLTQAVSAAVSTISLLNLLPTDHFSEFPLTRDSQLPASLGNNSLDIQLEEGFVREIALQQLPSPSISGILYQATVVLTWPSRNSGKSLTYRLNTLIAREKP